MRILIAGDWRTVIYEKPLFDSFTGLGHLVDRLGWYSYFQSRTISSRIQDRLLLGPILSRLNRDFLEKLSKFKPDVIFIFRGTHLFPETLKEVKRRLPRALMIGYNNDDPFSDKTYYFPWRHFIRSLPLYDIAFAYRHHNLVDFRNAGARRVELLRSWYIESLNRPVLVSAEDLKKYGADVTLIAHYEPDGRAQMVDSLVRAGIDMKLFGPNWSEKVVRRLPQLLKFAPILPLSSVDYNTAICSAKIVLCLFSKLNRDTYTRRCFEIPAARQFMLAEYTEDLASLYQEGQEAEYFRSQEELIEKIKFYLHHESARKKIAQAGYDRVRREGHDALSRAKQILVAIDSLMGSQSESG